ncbi:hypothetical protein GUK30_32590 [Rhizobium leguminosarum]|nr:hypothetical protein [Rhizobium ruizarguesonis]
MSSAGRVVMRSLDETGIKLRQLSEILSEDEFYAEGTSAVSMAWTFMHILSLEDWTINRIMRRAAPVLPYEVREAFKGGRPVTDEDRKKILPRRELEAQFSATREETLRLLSGFDESRWDEQTPVDCRFPTLGTVWENLANDCWWHLGQLSSSVPRFSGTTMAVTKPRYHSTDPDDVSQPSTP